MKAEIIRTIDAPVAGPDGGGYLARICGRVLEDGSWEGWVEFVPEAGGPTLRTTRETTQSDRRNFEHWAWSLRPVYLEGALDRALRADAPKPVPPLAGAAAPRFHAPAPDLSPGRRETVPPDHAALNPFLSYRRGEAVLRGEMDDLSTSELRTIVRAYHLGSPGIDPDTLSRDELVDLIVRTARDRTR